MTATKPERKVPFGWCLTGHCDQCMVAIGSPGGRHNPKYTTICPHDCHTPEQIEKALAKVTAEIEKMPNPDPIKPKATRTKTRTKTGGKPCTCGCGETTGGGNYRPGHDSRHVSKVVAGDASLDDLPTDALRAKARKKMET